MDQEQRTRALLENAGWVHALARQLLRNEALAEDVAQEALVIAIERPPQSLGTAGVRGWLSTVTRNLAFQVLRREAARGSVEAEAAPAEAQLDPTERLALQQSLARAVAELDGIYRDVIVMRFFDDVPPREIARRLGLPGATVRKRLSRALRQVGDRLRGELDGDGGDWLRSLALLVRARPRRGPFDLPSLPLLTLSLAGTALGVVLLVRLLSAPELARVLVHDELGDPVETARVYQMEGDQLRELLRGEGEGHVGARTDLGPLIVTAPDRLPQLYDPPRSGGALDLSLDGSTWFTGYMYVSNRPPEEPLELRLLVPPNDPRLMDLPPGVLESGILEREGESIVLRTRTGERGWFAFGGLAAGCPVKLLVPEHYRLDYYEQGWKLPDARGLEAAPPTQDMWMGVRPR